MNDYCTPLWKVITKNDDTPNAEDDAENLGLSTKKGISTTEGTLKVSHKIKHSVTRQTSNHYTLWHVVKRKFTHTQKKRCKFNIFIYVGKILVTTKVSCNGGMVDITCTPIQWNTIQKCKRMARSTELPWIKDRHCAYWKRSTNLEIPIM
jgi:hypothetical protein